MIRLSWSSSLQELLDSFLTDHKNLLWYLSRNLATYWLLCRRRSYLSFTLGYHMLLLFLNSAEVRRSRPYLCLLHGLLLSLRSPPLVVSFIILLLIAWWIVLTAFRILGLSSNTSVTLRLVATYWLNSSLSRGRIFRVAFIWVEVLILPFRLSTDRLLSLLFASHLWLETVGTLESYTLSNLFHAKLLTTLAIICHEMPLSKISTSWIEPYSCSNLCLQGNWPHRNSTVAISTWGNLY